MEDKSILIQCDEMTKNMMEELQEDMTESLMKVSKTMTAEVIGKIKPMEKKIHELKKELGDFLDDNDEFQEMVENLSGSVDSIIKSIENAIKSSIMTMMNEHSSIVDGHNKMISENLHKLIEDTQSIKERLDNSNNIIFEEIKKIDSKIDDRTFEQLEEKLAILGVKVVKDAARNKNEVLEKINSLNTEKLEEKMHELEQEMESNFSSSKSLMTEKFKGLSDKLDEKELLIKTIHVYENEISAKIKRIQEEIEWSNRPFFSRIFGRKRD
ncbi:hypothetical protein [uncultured Clostridium sp.]|uniref:hypothetical protein n=1 Tax=uncultured Clostridium sp. TaxID=59620 RepID=UPI0025DD2E40|nr:hypothetical protein [uncultured Clostridium sp.]